MDKCRTQLQFAVETQEIKTEQPVKKCLLFILNLFFKLWNITQKNTKIYTREQNSASIPEASSSSLPVSGLSYFPSRRESLSLLLR